MQGSFPTPFSMILPEIRTLSEMLKNKQKPLFTPFDDQQADVIKLLG